MKQYGQYNEEDICSMSGPELLMLLFDEAIERLKKAECSLADKDYEDFEDCLQRVSQIVRYLTDILDMDQPISADLRRIYVYLVHDIDLVRIRREQSQEEIGRISHILSELRTAFDGARRETDERV